MSLIPRVPVVACVMVFATVPSVIAQPARTIRANNRAMRIWTANIEQRKPGQPVVVLESGTGSGLDAWKPVFSQISRLAPTFAYDRSGLGGSEFDGERPT